MRHKQAEGLEGQVRNVDLFFGDLRLNLDAQDVQIHPGDLEGDLYERSAIVDGEVYGTQHCTHTAIATGDVYGTQRAKNAFASRVDGIQCGRKAQAVNVDGTQSALNAAADYLHGEQTAFLATAIEPESDGVQKGFLLWGPGNRGYNPSIGYQKLDGVNEDLGLCPTFRKAYSALKDYLS